MLDPFAPAHEVADAVRHRRLSAVEVMDATLARVERLNPALNAFVALRAEEARRDAAALDRRIAAGEEPGPLAGIPFGVKDLENLAGLPTTHGSVPFRDHVAHQDSTQVARLRRAGAIPIGKTNTPEFGCTAFTKNRLFGVTRNPWNLDRTPGGSSGGSAAAIAGGLVPLATGSDGGGSIRIPACYTGCFGLKPTFGLVSRGPFEFRDWVDTSVYGPITRCVLDAALFMDAVVGYDPHDPDSLPHPGHSYLERLDERPTGLRIAYSPTLGYARVDPDVRRVVEDAVRAIEQVLGRPVDPLPDRLTDVGMAWGGINTHQDRARLGPLFEKHYEEWGRGYRRGLEFGDRLTSAQLGSFQRERALLVEEVASIFARYDLLLTPTLPTVAFAAGGPLPRGAAGEDFTSPMHAVAFTYPFNMTGHPACTVRAGFSDDGLPIGLQLVADRRQEHLLLRVARAWEQHRPFTPWPADPDGS